MNLGGGAHHAGREFSRGYCLFNDIAPAVDTLRQDGCARTALVVDCDVHQGDGTAHLLRPDPLAFTVSLHGVRNAWEGDRLGTDQVVNEAPRFPRSHHGRPAPPRPPRAGHAQRPRDPRVRHARGRLRPNVADIVDIHAATAAEVVTRTNGRAGSAQVG